MDNGNSDAAAGARGNSDPSSPRAPKHISAAGPQRSARATSVEMADAPNNSGSSETDLSNTGSSATSIDAPQQDDLPDVDDQVAKVRLMSMEMTKEGQEGYLISHKWLERVYARTTEHKGRPDSFSKDATQGPIGPVDNSDLVDRDLLQDGLVDERGEDFIPLSKAMRCDEEFTIIPAKAWELVLGWYGLKEGSPILRRYAHNTVSDGSSENIQYELWPPVITIRKVRKATLVANGTTRSAEKIASSRSQSFLTFLEAAKKAADIDLSNKVRVWRILNTAPTDTPQAMQPAGIMTPDASPRGGSPMAPIVRQQLSLNMDVADFNSLTFGTERELVTGKDEKDNEDSNASLTLGDAGLSEDQIVVLEEHDETGAYISDTSKAATANKTARSIKGQQSVPNSGRSTPTSGALTRGRTRTGKVRGLVGLSNLGNTCYMNSALQCLRSVEELSMYFLNNKYKEEINFDNPIGHKGAMARVYGDLLNNIYSNSGTSSFSPKNFKQTLGREEKLFSGYGQQDSQEFVSWLVDALHEDLNRVHKKPYRENPDSDDNTFRDPEAIKALGEVYRANHRARNDSVAMDLFSGFYKNTMVCPECDKVSITFDPYSQLTLQLPIEQTWTHTITYVPLYGKPYQLEVDIDKNATIKVLKEYIGKRGGGVPANRLMASEVYSHKFYRHLDDNSTVSETNIGIRDDIYFFELDRAPTNWPAPKKKGSKYKILSNGSSDEDIPGANSPLHDRVLIPVFHRGPSLGSYRSSSHALALWPFYIVLTREEAADYDTILRKVIAKVAQSTTRPILSEISGGSLPQSQSSSDVVLTTEEDASPSDPEVKDGSVEGEDMVEVTMTDAASPPENDGSSGLPEVLRPGSFIPPELRQLFELKHTKRSTEIVTTGWSTVDHSRTFELITKRIRIPPSREDSIQSSPEGSENTSSDEDEDTTQAGTHVDVDAALDAANVSSDEEMQSVEPETSAFARSGRQNSKKNKRQRKQQRKQERKHKNNKNFKNKRSHIPEQPRYAIDPDDETDPTLIRMGEGLIIEWNPESYEALFGGTTDDDPRGQDFMKHVEVLNDPEIQDKKAKRIARKKHGITLEECFTETSKSEVLSEDNAWYCNRCKELRRATKTLEIWTLPDILIVHLKRFSGFRTFRDKIEDLVDAPVEGLDLSGKVGFPEGKDLVYDLFAVDNHYGGLGGGHYTATAQNFFDKQWYDYNDSIVSKHGPGSPVTRNAYLLFYRRRSSGPLGPPSLQQIVTAESSADSDGDEETEDNVRARSPAGNGLRLGDSSRNGSSSAGAVAAGVGALRGGGYQPSAVGSRLKNGAVAANLSDEDDEASTLPPAYNDTDEGYHDDNYNNNNNSLAGIYTPLDNFTDTAVWSFDNLRNNGNSHASDDAASDVPALGSLGDGSELGARMMEDFGDDEESGTRAGVSTPVDGISVRKTDDDVTEIRIPDMD